MNNATRNTSPLAARFRPTTFDEMVGQSHLVGEHGALRSLVSTGRLRSMVFFGPPGCGKTTAAAIIAEQSGMLLRRLNATSASLADVRKVADEADSLLGRNGVILYLDEIQYFNKKQQQSLLEYVEDGRITLVTSTTENPYFYVYDALLSRCSVFEFKPVTAAEIRPRLDAVLAELRASGETDARFTDGALDFIAGCAGGDVRKALTLLELTLACAEGGGDARRDEPIDEDFVRSVTPSVAAGRFDADGDVHYDLLSCLQKSIRGSDPDAALFYLAKLLEGGDIISPIRRLLVIASEDIGQAYPMAAVIVKACTDAAKELGLPEARIPLANAVVTLATAPKSNTAYLGLDAAAADIRAGKGVSVPRHLQSPLFKGYRYPHDFVNDWCVQQYLPDDLADRRYYEFGENKTEQAAKAYWERVKSEGERKKK